MTATVAIVGCAVVGAGLLAGRGWEPKPRLVAVPTRHLAIVDRIGAAAVDRVIPVLPSAATLSRGAVGWMLLTAAVAAPIAPPVGVGVVVVAAGWAVARARSSRRRREQAITAGIPHLIDHLGLAVAAGLPLRHACRASALRLPDAHRALLLAVLARVDGGAAFVAALDWYGAALGPAGHELITVLVASERDGAPLGPGLARAADASRRAHRRELERRARRLPVTMLLPLVVCILPAFVLLTLVPLLAGSLGDLRFPG